MIIILARLLVDDPPTYILTDTDCEGGNPVSVPGVGGSKWMIPMPTSLWTVKVVTLFQPQQ